MRQDELESVRHLVELGYFDPNDVATQKARLRAEQNEALQRALELIRQGRGQQAVTLLETIIQRDPEWIAPRDRLVQLYYNAGDWTAAQAQLDWLAHHGVVDPRLAVIAGGIALARRDLAAALEELQYARHVDANLPGVNTLLGMTLLRLGRWADAEAALRHAVQQNPADAQARDGMAVVCLRQGEYQEAADWALAAIEQNVRLFRAHYHLGLALAQWDRPDEAVQALEMSTQVDPSRTAPYRWLARIARDQLEDDPRAEHYRERGREAIRQRRPRCGRSST